MMKTTWLLDFGGDENEFPPSRECPRPARGIPAPVMFWTLQNSLKAARADSCGGSSIHIPLCSRSPCHSLINLFEVKQQSSLRQSNSWELSIRLCVSQGCRRRVLRWIEEYSAIIPVILFIPLVMFVVKRNEMNKVDYLGITSSWDGSCRFRLN